MLKLRREKEYYMFKSAMQSNMCERETMIIELSKMLFLHFVDLHYREITLVFNFSYHFLATLFRLLGQNVKYFCLYYPFSLYEALLFYLLYDIYAGKISKTLREILVYIN